MHVDFGLFTMPYSLGDAAPGDGRTPFRRDSTIRFSVCPVKEQYYPHRKFDFIFDSAWTGES
jgi:hypothetical protein